MKNINIFRWKFLFLFKKRNARENIYFFFQKVFFFVERKVRKKRNLSTCRWEMMHFRSVWRDGILASIGPKKQGTSVYLSVRLFVFVCQLSVVKLTRAELAELCWLTRACKRHLFTILSSLCPPTPPSSSLTF